MKRCTICGETKTYEAFHRQASRPDGYGNWCRPCKSEKKRADYIANPAPALARAEKCRNLTPAKAKLAKAAAYAKKADEYKAKHRRHYEENREETLAKCADYRARNKARIGQRDRQYVRQRMAADPLFRLTYSVRNRIFLAFRDRKIEKRSKTRDMLGCDWPTLKAHIEAKFKPGMGWDNRSEWHIDHKIPLASAKSEEEMIALCHYTNLQPLWAGENLAKGSRMLVSGAA